LLQVLGQSGTEDSSYQLVFNILQVFLYLIQNNSTFPFDSKQQTKLVELLQLYWKSKNFQIACYSILLATLVSSILKRSLEEIKGITALLHMISPQGKFQAFQLCMRILFAWKTRSVEFQWMFLLILNELSYDRMLHVNVSAHQPLASLKHYYSDTEPMQILQTLVHDISNQSTELQSNSAFEVVDTLWQLATDGMIQISFRNCV
jgi:hypothetical protein